MWWGNGRTYEWLRWERASGRRDYGGMCAGAAADAAGFAAAGLNANQWAWSIRKSIRHYGLAPSIGLLQFYEGGTYGHVGWTLRNHVLMCNTASGAIGRMQMSYYDNVGPTFWVDPVRYPEVFRHCIGDNTDKFGTPPPQVTPLAWPLVPGKDYRRIIDVKAAFDWPNRTPHYGRVLERRVRQYESRHPEYGPVDGRIGPKEFAAIVCRKAYRSA